MKFRGYSQLNAQQLLLEDFRNHMGYWYQIWVSLSKANTTPAVTIALSSKNKFFKILIKSMSSKHGKENEIIAD